MPWWSVCAANDMSLSSTAFLIFLAGALLVYYLTPLRFRWIVLLLASGVFYLSYSPAAAVYLCGTIAMTYGAARWLEALHRKEKERLAGVERGERPAIKKKGMKQRRRVLAAALCLNFLTLAVFKYLDWLLSGVNSLIALTGSGFSFRPLGLLLPLGLSFYIFQTSGYLIDVYRGKVQAEHNVFKYALFAAYFPQMIQGPIHRYQELQPRLFAEHPFRAENLRDGIELMLWGMLKKVLIADTLAAGVAELYGNYAAYNGIVVFFGAALYCLQLYCDFSGGIDIVRGVSTMFGIELGVNFRRPYFATSVDDFWRRWHISLGEWMKDYVFYPLALSRWLPRFCKRFRKHLGQRVGKLLVPCISTVVVFLLVGIWQGPGLQNIAYGLWNGLLMSGAMLCAPLFEKWKHNGRLMHVFRILRTCFLVTIGRFFSRADSLASAWGMLRHSFTHCLWNLSPGAFLSFGLDLRGYLTVFLAGLILFFVSYRQEKGVHIRQSLAQKKPVVQFFVLLAAVLIVMAAVYLNGDYTAIAYVYESV